MKNFIFVDNEHEITFGSWFNDLIKLGQFLNNFRDSGFFFSITVPECLLSGTAISLGLCKGMLENSTNKVEEIDIEKLVRGDSLSIKVNDKYTVCKFLEYNSIESLGDEVYLKIEIDGEKKLVKQVPLSQAKRVLNKYSENPYSNINLETGKEIKSSFRGFEQQFLDYNSYISLKENFNKKILFISTKIDMQKIAGLKCKIDHQNEHGLINDILRVKQFCSGSEPFYSDFISYRSRSKKHELTDLTDCNFQIFLGSSAFLKLQNSQSKIKNSIVLISPQESLYELAIAEINSRFTERQESFNFDLIKNLNLKYKATMFKK